MPSLVGSEMCIRDMNIELDSIVEEQNIEEVDPIDEEPAEEVELPEEVVDSEQDSQNIEEKEE